MMTLEEAIKHCKDVALSCTNKECALEHFQLLKWLQEYSNMLEKQGEQEPAWSEEDEEYLNFVIVAMKNLQVKCTENEIKRHSNSQAAPYYAKVINWLKSLRPQKQWKPNKEQMEALWNVYEGEKNSQHLLHYIAI